MCLCVSLYKCVSGFLSEADESPPSLSQRLRFFEEGSQCYITSGEIQQRKITQGGREQRNCENKSLVRICRGEKEGCSRVKARKVQKSRSQLSVELWVFPTMSGSCRDLKNSALGRCSSNSLWLGIKTHLRLTLAIVRI